MKFEGGRGERGEERGERREERGEKEVVQTTGQVHLCFGAGPGGGWSSTSRIFIFVQCSEYIP